MELYEQETTQQIVMGPQLENEKKEQLQDLLHKCEKVTQKSPGRTHLVQHRIPTTMCSPIWQRPYRIPQAYANKMLSRN